MNHEIEVEPMTGWPLLAVWVGIAMFGVACWYGVFELVRWAL